MAVGVASLRCSYRAALQQLPSERQLLIAQPTAARFLSTSAPKAITLDVAPANADFDPSWAMTKESTRLVPVSASYFTGNADFFDNWLALQELLRKHQLLPTVSKELAPSAKWKTLAQYKGIVGRAVKAASYKKIVNILDRLNCINPEVIPDEVKISLELYKRDAGTGVSQKKEHTLDKYGRAFAVGRRKTSIATVAVVEGKGEVIINGQPLALLFERLHDRESAIWPLLATHRLDKYNVWATVNGGGKTGQAEALTLGVARALLIHEPALKPALRRGVFPVDMGSSSANWDPQLDVLPVIPEWSNVRSPVTSRPARCLPGSSVKEGLRACVLYLYNTYLHCSRHIQATRFCLILLDCNGQWSQQEFDKCN